MRERAGASAPFCGGRLRCAGERATMSSLWQRGYNLLGMAMFLSVYTDDSPPRQTGERFLLRIESGFTTKARKCVCV